MPQYVKVGGTWRTVDESSNCGSVKVAGTWRTVTNTYVKVGGTWRNVCVPPSPTPTPTPQPQPQPQPQPTTPCCQNTGGTECIGGVLYNLRYDPCAGTSCSSVSTGQSCTPPATYLVQYATGGSGVSNLPSNQTKTQNVPLTLSGTTPVRSGYVFQYWNGSDGNTYGPGSSYTTNANLTLTAVWVADSPTTTYWATGCCSTNNQQVTGTSNTSSAAAQTSMNSQCTGSVSNVQTGTGGSIPQLNCASTFTTYWHTGCCSSDNQQKTGYSTSNFTEAFNNMLSQCSGGSIPSLNNGSYTSNQSSNVPTLNCTVAPTPTPTATTYWSTGCCLNTNTNTRSQVTGTSTASAGAAVTNRDANCTYGTVDQNIQSGSYTGTSSNIPSITCTNPTPTPQPQPSTTYWATGCCLGATYTQVTGTSTSSSTAAYNNMTSQCPAGVTLNNVSTGTGGSVPGKDCGTAPILTSCSSQSSANCTGLCGVVPNVVGSCGAGFALLNFSPVYNYVGTSDGGLAGCIISQTPAGGTCADNGSTVTLTAYQYQASPTPTPTSTTYRGCCCDGTSVSGGYNNSSDAQTGLSNQCGGSLCAGPTTGTPNCSAYSPSPSPQPSPQPQPQPQPQPTVDCPGQTPGYGQRCTAGDLAFDLFGFCSGGVGTCSFASGAVCLLYCI